MIRTERLHLGVLVVGLLAAGWFLATRQTPGPEVRRARSRLALDTVPAGAAVVLTANFDRLRELGFGRFWASRERELGGVGKLSEICGFDPTEALRELALSVPATRLEELELGFVATGDFSEAGILDCASRVVARRGGQPFRGRARSFATLADRTHPAWGEIAVRERGPVLLGQGTYLRELIDTSEGERRSVTLDPEHADLRRALAPGGIVVVSAVLARGSARAWLADAGVELDALGALAARFDFAPDLVAELVLGCEGPCAKLRAQATDVGERLFAPYLELALGGAPAAAQVESEPGRLRIRWRLGREQTRRGFELLANWLG